MRQVLLAASLGLIVTLFGAFSAGLALSELPRLRDESEGKLGFMMVRCQLGANLPLGVIEAQLGVARRELLGLGGAIEIA